MCNDGQKSISGFEGRVQLLTSAPDLIRKQATLESFRRTARCNKDIEEPSVEICQPLGSHPCDIYYNIITCTVSMVTNQFSSY